MSSYVLPKPYLLGNRYMFTVYIFFLHFCLNVWSKPSTFRVAQASLMKLMDFEAQIESPNYISNMFLPEKNPFQLIYPIYSTIVSDIYTVQKEVHLASLERFFTQIYQANSFDSHILEKLKLYLKAAETSSFGAKKLINIVKLWCHSGKLPMDPAKDFVRRAVYLNHKVGVINKFQQEARRILKAYQILEYSSVAESELKESYYPEMFAFDRMDLLFYQEKVSHKNWSYRFRNFRDFNAANGHVSDIKKWKDLLEHIHSAAYSMSTQENERQVNELLTYESTVYALRDSMEACLDLFQIWYTATYSAKENSVIETEDLVNFLQIKHQQLHHISTLLKNLEFAVGGGLVDMLKRNASTLSKTNFEHYMSLVKWRNYVLGACDGLEKMIFTAEMSMYAIKNNLEPLHSSFWLIFPSNHLE